MKQYIEGLLKMEIVLVSTATRRKTYLTLEKYMYDTWKTGLVRLARGLPEEELAKGRAR
jgi:hypothetical protein